MAHLAELLPMAKAALAKTRLVTNGEHMQQVWPQLNSLSPLDGSQQRQHHVPKEYYCLVGLDKVTLYSLKLYQRKVSPEIIIRAPEQSH
ncbi:hypothetical protein DUI87_29079 [Hirundo rustica rustica]|uniref:Uncharacterized protein n=1 Tax=Hirundo rustica rustica TaxID=333673 RepID=A0A3M0J0N3_HIRRU|nr:hypothetical protein DUI87_29079 [Hirundo rustica rustica]